jgi:predicted permease
MKQVFVMLAAMPAMTNTSIVAKYYGADYQYAAMLTVITTCLAIVVDTFLHVGAAGISERNSL